MNRTHFSTAAQRFGTLSLALLACAAATPTSAAIYNMQAGLSGAQEVPAVTTNGSAALSAVYNDETNVLLYTVTYRLDSASTSLTMAHLHGPATAGQTAPPLVTLDISTASGTNSFFSAGAVLNATQEDYLKTNRLYINLHSNQFQSGELRAQVSPILASQTVVSFPVNSLQEPSQVVLGSANPQGYLTAGYDPPTRRLTVGTIYSGLTSNAQMAHLHGPAAIGETAPAIYTFNSIPAGTSGVMVQRFSLTATQEQQLRDGLLYYNLHTVNNTGGEIRGQLQIGSTQFADMDGDGLSDEAELSLKTMVDFRDSDGDSIEDGVERVSGTDPLVANGAAARTDNDRDLLPNAVDTVPNNPDSDGDGFLDGYEVATSSDPRSAASRPVMGDVDRNGRIDNVDAVMALSRYLGYPVNAAYNLERGDLNRDGDVDNVDVTLLFNYFLGNIRTLPQAPPSK